MSRMFFTSDKIGFFLSAFVVGNQRFTIAIENVLRELS